MAFNVCLASVEDLELGVLADLLELLWGDVAVPLRQELPQSDVAQQFFCEKKVEMQYLHGEIETEATMVGSAAHGKLLEDAVRVDREEL